MFGYRSRLYSTPPAPPPPYVAELMKPKEPKVAVPPKPMAGLRGVVYVPEPTLEKLWLVGGFLAAAAGPTQRRKETRRTMKRTQG
jgi:hypothetical protein